MNKRQKRACVLLLVGLVFLCGALCIHIVQLRQDAMAAETAAVLLKQLELDRLPVIGNQQLENAASDPLLPERQYMGYQLIGSLSIPSVDIQLPVLNDWDDAMLKIAPCRYRGSISDGNLIIMGHNYKSHFTPLRSVAPGAAVEFRNTDGKVFRYKVAEIETIHRNDGERLASAYPLTIFTCSPGGIYRFVVRCERIEQ